MEDKHNSVQGNEPIAVPYVVYRDAIAHDRWAIKGLIIALVITIFLLFASNAIWIYYWNQFDYASEETTTTVDSEGEGIANYVEGNVVGNGGVIIGEDNSTDSEEHSD